MIKEIVLFFSPSNLQSVEVNEGIYDNLGGGQISNLKMVNEEKGNLGGEEIAVVKEIKEQSRMEDVITSLVPSYKDIVQRKPLQVYEGCFVSPSGLTGVVEQNIDSNDMLSPLTEKKGVVFGGLSKNFSLIKTRISRKKVEMNAGVSRVSGESGSIPRALRDNKSLAREKK
jgi:hypothetical protein